MHLEMKWNYDEVMAKNPQFKQSDIDKLRSWIQQLEPGSLIPKDITDSLLLCFHNASNLAIEDTKKCIKQYYSIRQKLPEVFDNRQVGEQLEQVSEFLDVCMFPEKTDEGYAIFYVELKDVHPSIYHHNNCLKVLFMIIDRCLIEFGPLPGAIFIMNTEQFRFGHMARINFISMPKLAVYAEEALPIKLKKFHVVNSPWIHRKFLSLIKPFLSNDIWEMFHLYPPTNELKGLLQANNIPDRCLPPKYGGTLPQIAKMHQQNMEMLAEYEAYFREEEKQRHQCFKKGEQWA